MHDKNNQQAQLLDLAYLRQAFARLAERKGWQVYHTPKNLAAAVAVEAAELLEIFQWLSDEQASAITGDITTKNKVADEVADVMMYLVELCARLDIDIVAAVAQKIHKNEQR
jgi:NTP pyrophosphatase (non-canonical NTP hydrolase)